MGEVPKTLQPYALHGVEFTGTSGDTHLTATCPYCERSNKFMVHKTTGQYKCHVCAQSGNVYTFLQSTADMYNESTHPDDWEALSEARKGVPADAFRAWNLGYCTVAGAWMLPQYTSNGTVANIGQWRGPGYPIVATKGCKKQLFGVDKLAKAKPGTHVYLCGGEWDTMALAWLAKHLKQQNVLCVGTPGETMWRPEWTPLLDGMHVYLAYDADNAGLTGMMKVGTALKAHNAMRSLQYIHWPDGIDKGYDISDWVAYGVRNHRQHLQKCWDRLGDLFKIAHPDGLNADAAHGEGEAVEGEKPEHIPDWPELLGVFQKHVHMDPDMHNALVLSLAVAFAIDMRGDPLWLYLVAPPGGGKTTILNGFRGSHTTIFRSSLGPKSLVSGFQSNKDPSLLPQLRGKLGVFKDATELLTLHPSERAEVNGVLRGAYDGDVDRSYGNGVTRIYRNLHFGLLMGVTPSIYAVSDTELGERFLKFQMDRKPNQQTLDARLDAVLNSIGKEDEAADAMQQATAAFLWRRLDLDALPLLPEKYAGRIKGTAKFVSQLRARVDREQYGMERNIRAQPFTEVGTRLVKVLCKLAMCIAHVLHKDAVDAEVYDLVQHVAWDSCSAFHGDIVRAFCDDDQATLTIKEVQAAVGMASSCGQTIRNRMDDLHLLGVLTKDEGSVPVMSNGRVARGRPSIGWSLSTVTRQYMREAGASGNGHSNGAVRVKVPGSKLRVRRRRAR